MTYETAKVSDAANGLALAARDALLHWAEVHHALMEEERKLCDLAGQVALQKGCPVQLECAQQRVAVLRDLDDAVYRSMMAGGWDA